VQYDISCQAYGGSAPAGGCLVGAGMVHPAVFEAVGIDPERYTGFAFGLGIDRIAMQQWQVDDLRLLVDNDVRFLSQFA
jgi:phenylalanyl-tRNA synthetase alpha chain